MSQCTVDEIERLFAVFQNEVETVYPVIDSHRLARRGEAILAYSKTSGEVRDPAGCNGHPELTRKGFEIAKVALATAMVIESPEAISQTTLMVESVEKHGSNIRKSTVDVEELQLLALLVSISFRSHPFFLIMPHYCPIS